MASIENRSRFIVTVQNREDLTRTFACTRDKELKRYIAKLKADGYKPKLVRTDDYYAIRVRDAGHRVQCLYARLVFIATLIIAVWLWISILKVAQALTGMGSM